MCVCLTFLFHCAACDLSQIHDRMLLGGLKASESTFFKTTHDAVRVAVDGAGDAVADDAAPAATAPVPVSDTDADTTPAAVAMSPAVVMIKGGSSA